MSLLNFSLLPWPCLNCTSLSLSLCLPPSLHSFPSSSPALPLRPGRTPLQSLTTSLPPTTCGKAPIITAAGSSPWRWASPASTPPRGGSTSPLATATWSCCCQARSSPLCSSSPDDDDDDNLAFIPCVRLYGRSWSRCGLSFSVRVIMMITEELEQTWEAATEWMIGRVGAFLWRKQGSLSLIACVKGNKCRL